MSVSDASATEGDEVEFTVSLSAPTGRSVYVDLKPEVGPGDTATLLVDFVDFKELAVVARHGRRHGSSDPPSFTVGVITVDDDIDEEDETFTVRLSNPSGA